MSRLLAYIGRGNSARIQLLNKTGRQIDPGVVQRAVLRFGDWCIDTDDATHPIQLAEGARAVDVQVGLIQDLRVGVYQGYLTVSDAETVESGLAWAMMEIHVHPWKACVGGDGQTVPATLLDAPRDGEVYGRMNGAWAKADPKGSAAAAVAGHAALTTDAHGGIVATTDARLTGDRTPTVHGSDKHSEAYEPANANIQDHITSTANPHTVTAVQAGADPTGTAAGLMTTHTTAHPAPTVRDDRNEAAGVAASTMSAHTTDHPAPTTRDSRNEPANANIQAHVTSAHAPSDAQKNVQSDWNQATVGEDDFIKNKPTSMAPTSHDNTAHSTNYEAELGNPAENGQVLSSSTTGVRTWVPHSGGGSITISGTAPASPEADDLWCDRDNFYIYEDTP